MPRRRPQSRCKCGHAKSQHGKAARSYVLAGVDYYACCGFCWDKCLKFEQDNLATLEKLNEFMEQKTIERQEIINKVSL